MFEAIVSTGVLDRWHNGLLIYWRTSSSCIRLCLVSCACDWVMPALSAVLLTFSFQFSLLFYVGSQAAAAAYMYVHGLPNIGHRTLPEMWEVRSLYAAYSPWERLWIDFNGKMEIKYPVEGYFDSEFRAICNHCGVMVTWSRKAFLFWKKTNPYRKIF